MGKTPFVSVIMPAFNVERYVGEAIRSVLDQTFDNFELIIRDDGSTDGTRREIEQFHDPRIRVVEETRHVGGAAARNEAMAIARGEYFAVMDSDDIMEPTLIEKKVAFLQTHPEIGAVGCALRRMASDGTPADVRRYRTDCDTVQLHLMVHNTGFPHGGLVMRSESVGIVGGYRPNIPCSFDYDFKLRLVEGFNVANLEEPLYRCRTWPGRINVAKRELQRLWHWRNRQAMRQRRLTGRDDLSRETPDMGVLHMETRSRGEASHVYCLWSRGFLHERIRDVAAARACALKAVRLTPWRWRGWRALTRSPKGRCGS